MDSHVRAEATQVLDDYLSDLAELRADPATQEIMINRHDRIWVERAGVMTRTDIELDPSALNRAIVILANLNDKKVSPLLDARLPGLRIAAARSPVAVHGDLMSIRQHSRTRLGLGDYERGGAFDVVRMPVGRISDRNDELLDRMKEGGASITEFFEWAMRTRKNIALSGGTSSGKTTLLNALTDEIPPDDRVVTIEDTAELDIRQPNYISLESNQDISLRMLVRFALRVRPDRIVVGEVRGAEAVDMINALRTGHRGSVFTFHADSSDIAPFQLEDLVRMSEEGKLMTIEDLRQKIAHTFQFFVHCERVDGKRGPVEIREVLGVENGRYQTRLLFNRFVDFEELQHA